LVTGDSGFKGAWLVSWLTHLGASVYGLSLAPNTEPSLFERCRLSEMLAGRHEADVNDAAAVRSAIETVEPEIVFHLAAQALVRVSYEDPVGTYATNVMGTVHLLEAIRRRGKPCAVVVCTSDKCYENRESWYAYRENDPLGGRDAYSASKAATEIAVASFRDSFFSRRTFEQHGIALATVRAGNAIGPGDWARDRIVPDTIRALYSGTPVSLRNPRASRPWQHVLEPLSGYLCLGAELLSTRGADFAEAWNFGPYPGSAQPVQELVAALIEAWGGGSWVTVESKDQPHEAGQLRLAIDKAVARLGWGPLWDLRVTARRTAVGYRRLEREFARDVLLEEITDYEREGLLRGTTWAA
jgi:CDP-glucose 4,6-dehydratase